MTRSQVNSCDSYFTCPTLAMKLISSFEIDGEMKALIAVVSLDFSELCV